jgi:putative ABC transport system permease protein
VSARPRRLTLLRLAWREIRNHPRFALFFAANLALGFAGFAALDAFEVEVSRALHARSQAHLGADVAVTTRRPPTPAEQRELDALAGPGAVAARAVVLFSMVGGGERARLVELRAIDDALPLYGEIALEGLGPADAGARAALRDGPGAWLDPALLAQLGVGVGDRVRIGEASFRVDAVIDRDGGRASTGFSIAPRVYVARERLEATGLVATGSRIEHQRLYRLAPGADASAVAAAMRARLDDPAASARSHDEATRDLARTYAAVARYLGLVALVAVFLAGLGAAHLFRAHLGRRLADLAVLLSLGATRANAQAIFLTELALLGLAAGALALGIAAGLLPLLALWLGDAAPPGFEPRIGLRSIAIVAGLAGLAGPAACLPLVAQLRRLRPAELFAEHARPSLAASPRDALWWAPAAAGFWALACWRSDSLLVGSAFGAIFGAAALVFAGLGLAALAGLEAWPRPRRLATRLALRDLARGRVRTLAAFVALALCALLLGLVPQLRAVLDRDLERPDGAALPSLFLFDIQPEQRDALAAHVAAQGARLERLSPMVRARLDAVNGAPLARDPDAPAPGRGSRLAGDGEGDARRLRSRRYNLTYRASLNDSELLRAGRAFGGAWDPARPDAPAEMSLEEGFAERLGVGLGDTLRFDVQGVAVEGRVVNLREVRWNSFQPNFFVLFQPGVLEDAPAVFLASVPTLPTDARERLQSSLQTAFPNVSSIDVTRAVERLLALIAQLEWALAGTAAFAFAVGWLLVTALARDVARARRWEINLLKVLGAELGLVRRALDTEFALLGALGAVAGAGASLAASALLTRWVLDVSWAPAFGPLLAPVLGIPLVCVVSARAAARGVLRERPLALLQAPPT